MITVLYDGWPLAYAPNSSGALHLIHLLERRPAEVRAVVGLPAPAALPLPPGVETELRPALARPALARPGGALNWEQRLLPRLAQETGAALIHQCGGYPPLLGRTPVVMSPTQPGWPPSEPAWPGLVGRAQYALGYGGLSRLRAVLWPQDFPAPDGGLGPDTRLLRLPPGPAPGFLSAAAASPPDANGRPVASSPHDLSQSPELPESFVLYHGSSRPEDLHRLLDAWTWTGGAVGDAFPLLLVGLDATARQIFPGLAGEYGVGDTVRPLPDLPLSGLAWLYHHCAAVFHPAPLAPWGGSLRLALACGKPIVALNTPAADRLVGPAGYLAPQEPRHTSGTDEGRLLGAALVTVLVEESVSEALSQAARRRAAGWQQEDFSSSLLEAYRSALS